MRIEVLVQRQLKQYRLDIGFRSEANIIGVIGESGSGKSMLLKMIAGIERPDYGKIKMNQKIVDDTEQGIMVRPQQRNIGYLFQNYSLFPNMTVEQNLGIGLEHKSKLINRQKIIDEWLERFQLTDLRQAYPHKLSGGQQQRVALARILVYQPELLLLDEPFAALDSHLKEKLREELRGVLQEYPGQVILVTHSRAEAYELCQQLLCIKDGQVVQNAPTLEVFDQPKDYYVAGLTGCKNLSPIERIDQTTVYAKAWGMRLTLDSEKLNAKQSSKQRSDLELVGIGIRAHDLVGTDQAGENCYPVQDPIMSNTPFHWNVLLKNGLWWKISKNSHILSQQLPSYVQIPKQRIILFYK